jgi:hypothetical protein
MLSRTRMSGIESKITDFQDNINSLELSVLLSNALNNETLSCKFLKGKLNQTKQLLEELGEQVVEYEEQAKIKTDDYKIIKKSYISVRVEYWLMLEKLKTQCNNNYTTILFFYRTKTPCAECRDQGVILTHLITKNPDIYSIPVDADEDLLIIELIKEAFHINQTPSIVIDANKVIMGLVTEEQILDTI